jgi:hypothetical protein
VRAEVVHKHQSLRPAAERRKEGENENRRTSGSSKLKYATPPCGLAFPFVKSLYTSSIRSSMCLNALLNRSQRFFLMLLKASRALRVSSRAWSNSPSMSLKRCSESPRLKGKGIVSEEEAEKDNEKDEPLNRLQVDRHLVELAVEAGNDRRKLVLHVTRTVLFGVNEVS